MWLDTFFIVLIKYSAMQLHIESIYFVSSFEVGVLSKKEGTEVETRAPIAPKVYMKRKY